MSNIPTEIWTMIYEMLPSSEDKLAFSRVCSIWENASQCSMMCCGMAPCKRIAEEVEWNEDLREWEDNQEDDLFF
jgi:hypothetical protein